MRMHHPLGASSTDVFCFLPFFLSHTTSLMSLSFSLQSAGARFVFFIFPYMSLCFPLFLTPLSICLCRNGTNWDRLNPEELCQRLQDASRKVAGRFLEASWRRWHSCSGFSLSQFVLFLHDIPDRLDDDEIRSLCGALVVVRLLVQTKISLYYYN